MPLYKCPNCESKRSFTSKRHESRICQACDDPIIIPSLLIFHDEPEIERLVQKRDGELRNVKTLLDAGSEKEAVSLFGELFGEDDYYSKQAITAIRENGISENIGVYKESEDPEFQDRLYQNADPKAENPWTIYIIGAVLGALFILALWLK